MNAAQSLVFQETQFDVIDQEGRPWLKAADIARALGYAREDSVSRIYDRNADEFTSAMSQTVNLTVSGKINGLQNLTVRIFSLRGAHLLAMFARTPVAKAFRKWVLDVLDMVTGNSATVNDSTIGTAGLSCLAAVIDGKVRHLPAPARRSAKMHIWQQLHKAFSVVRAEQIPADKMDSARNFIAAQAVEGEWIGAEPAAPAYVVTQAEANWLNTMFVLMDDMVSVLREVRPALRSLDSPLCAKAYDSSAHIVMYQSEWQRLRDFCMGVSAQAK
ncbi:BRO family protein [Aquitalea sp. USM4]|uniref:BRO family protein n=1 Tax=Aquitalea sp. USM4 TaxID=1590041 RepID=UPI00103FEB5A|nr:BRO family protein [Aquitalea sp. USM4]QBJ80511.1 hypothetical protein DKK66_19880 [Aquitalea sp. USM4]